MVVNKGPSLIQLKKVDKSFTMAAGSELQVLKELDLTIYDNEFVAILGPTGAGKSTTLRILSGLMGPDHGEVLVRGKEHQGSNPLVSLVFQSSALFPWETVYSNIALALKPLDLSRDEVNRRVKKVIDLVGLEGFEEAYPRELSGGMKQRVGIARALVMDRAVLLLDEPFASLDVLTADALRNEVVGIWADKKTESRSVVLVTHNIQEAVQMAKRILILGRNPATVRHEIMVDLPYPRDEQTTTFQRMVARIHEMLADTVIPDAPQVSVGGDKNAPGAARVALIEALPNVQINELIGFLEAIGDSGGAANVFDMAQKTGRDFGSTLYLAKAAELLYFVDTPRHNILLTKEGRQFFDADINQRKYILNQQFGQLHIVQMATNLLLKRPEHRIQVDELLERVAEWIPYEDPHIVVDVLISWGRFAEYFGYNDDAKEIYLDRGEENNLV